MQLRALATVVGILAFTIVPDPASAGSAGPDVQAKLSAAAASRAVAVSGPIIGVTPLALNFGVVNIGEQATRGYTIQNVGDEDLEIAAIVISTLQITTDAPLPLVVHPGGSFPAIATYAPSGGPLAATLEFRSNSSFGPFTINASGRANSAPVLHPIGALSASAFVELRFTVTASDPDSDPVSFLAQGLPVGATFDEGAGEFAWTPVPTDEGVHTVSFVATDGFASDNETVAITVTVPIHPPVLQQPADMTAIALGTADQTLTATDPDGDPLSYSKVSGPSYVTVPTTNPGSGSTIGRIHLEPGILDAAASVAVRVSDGTLSDQKSLNVSIVSGHTSGNFGAPANYGTGGLSLGFAVGDLSGDGRLDVAVTNPISGTVSVLLGNGDGSFGATADYAAGIQPGSIAAGDLNGDGWLDLAVTNSGVSVLLGGGSAGFGGKLDYATGAQPRGVVVGDLNGDGRLDLAVTNAASNTVSVLLGNGDGSFAAKTDYGTEPGPGPIAVGDLNGDGRLDLTVVSPASSTVSTLLGNGSGSFGAPTSYATGSHPVSVAVGDLNGDRRLDLAVANVSSGTVSVFLGQGDGKLGAKTDYPTGCEANSVAMGDLNGDGKLDLAVQNGCSITLSILFGNGDGSFGPKTDYGVGGNGVAIRDLDGDGLLDLVVKAGGTNTVSVLLQLAQPPSPPAHGTLDQVNDGLGTGGLTNIFPGNRTGQSFVPTCPFLVGIDVGLATLNHGSGGETVTMRLYDNTGRELASTSSFIDEGFEGFHHFDIPDGGIPVSPGATYRIELEGSVRVVFGWVITGETYPNGTGDFYGSPQPWDYRFRTYCQAPELTVSLDVVPAVINLKSHGQWITAFIEPDGFDVAEIDPSSVRLEGIAPAGQKVTTAADHDHDGLPDLSLKFSRSALAPLLSVGEQALRVTGSLRTGERFGGSDSVRVVDPAGGHPRAAVAPNPLNPAGVLTFSTTRPGPVSIKVFDLQGRLVTVLVQARPFAAGSHEVRIDSRGDAGRPYSSGVYFYRVDSPDGTMTGRFAILK